MKIVRPAVRVFAVGEESRPTAFLFNAGARSAVFEFQRQLELDEFSQLIAGQLDEPSDDRLRAFIADNEYLFDEVGKDASAAFLTSVQSRQLSYYACVSDVESALLCLSRIEAARVMIVGVGGIGCHVADHLARIGVRRFQLVDYDFVEASNLNRQVLYTADDLGQPKAETAARRLCSIWGSALETVSHKKFSPELFNPPSDQPTMIFVSADSAPFQLRRDIVAWAFAIGVPYAFLGYVGQNAAVSPIVFDQTGGCGSCATVAGTPESWLWPLARHKALDMPPSSYAMNAIIAALAVDLWTRNLMGRVSGALAMYFSMDDQQARTFVAERDPTCPVCSR